jgi:2-oxo-3-hexenedioate decarboxylase
MAPNQVALLADELLSARSSGRQLPLITERPSATGPELAEFKLADAYAVAEQIRLRRMAGGERVCGYKIGFTNRSIWPKYGVHAPIWAPVWDTTLQTFSGTAATVSLAGLVEPRLEPEIVFGFARSPEPGMNEDDLVACLDWVAHGFEVVHTHFAGWRFAAPDTVADFGLHGRLLVGPRCAAERFAGLSDDLAAVQIELWGEGQLTDRGQGSAVLDSPVRALHLWLQAMAAVTPGWAVQAGDVVTTGTLTDAWPLRPGQRWATRLSDARLPGFALQLED